MSAGGLVPLAGVIEWSSAGEHLFGDVRKLSLN